MKVAYKFKTPTVVIAYCKFW